MNSFKTPMENFSTKVDQEMFSDLMKPSFRLAKKSLEDNVDLFSFSCSEKVKETLSLMGVQLSPFPLFSHSHPACKMIENQILYKVLPSLFGNKSWTVMSTKKEKFVKICGLAKVDRMNSNLLNRLVVNKDFSRYSELPPVDWIEPIGKLTKKIRSHGLFIHDEIHHWSKATLFAILKGCSSLREVIATVVYPVEILRGEVASHFPELYDFELVKCNENDDGFFDDSSGPLTSEDQIKLIFAPDGVYSEAYEQRADLNFIFEASHFLVDDQVWTVSKVCTYGAHHVFSFVKGDFRTESIRVWGNFKTVDLTALNRYRKNSEFPPIRKDSIDKVYSYLKCLKKPDVQSGIAKARQLLAETLTAPETMFYEKLCSLILDHRNGVRSQQCFGTSFFGDAYLKFVLALPDFIARLLPSSSEKFLFDFLRTLEYFKVRVPTRRVALYESLILDEAEAVIRNLDRDFKGNPIENLSGGWASEVNLGDRKGRPYRISSTWADGFEFIFKVNACCKFWSNDVYLGANWNKDKARNLGREFTTFESNSILIKKIALDSMGNQLQICWQDNSPKDSEDIFFTSSDCIFIKDCDDCGSRQFRFFYSGRGDLDHVGNSTSSQCIEEECDVDICGGDDLQVEIQVVSSTMSFECSEDVPCEPVSDDTHTQTDEQEIAKVLKGNPSLKAVTGVCSSPSSCQFSEVKGDGFCFIYAMEKASGMLFDLVRMQGLVEKHYGTEFSNEFKIRCFEGWHNEVSVAAFSNCLGLNICVHIDGGSKVQFYSPIREGEFDKVCVALHGSNHFNTLFEISNDIPNDGQESFSQFVDCGDCPNGSHLNDQVQEMCPVSESKPHDHKVESLITDEASEDEPSEKFERKMCVINAISSACGKGAGSILKILRSMIAEDPNCAVKVGASEKKVLTKVNGDMRVGLNLKEFGILIAILKRHPNLNFKSLLDSKTNRISPTVFSLILSDGEVIDLISGSRIDANLFSKSLDHSCCFFEVSEEHVIHLSHSNRKKIWDLSDLGFCLDGKLGIGLEKSVSVAIHKNSIGFEGDEIPYLVRFEAGKRLAEAFEKGDVGLIMQNSDCVADLVKIVRDREKSFVIERERKGNSSILDAVKDSLPEFGGLINSENPSLELIVAVKAIFGFGGSGKSFDFIEKVNQLPKGIRGLVISPREFLCKEISSKIHNKECKVLTFERAIEWIVSEGSMVDYILIDEFTLLPIGYLDLVLCLTKKISLEVVLIGDPLQSRDFQRHCDYLAPIHEIDLISETSGRVKKIESELSQNGRLDEVFKALTERKEVKINVISYRMYSKRFGNHPMFSDDFDFMGEEDVSFKMIGSPTGDPMKMAPDFLENLTLVASKVESDIFNSRKEKIKLESTSKGSKNKLSLNSNVVSTISKSQGLTKEKVKIFLTQSIELIDDLTWMVALTRCSRSIEFVNISGKSYDGLANNSRSGWLKKSLRGEKISKDDVLEKLCNYKILEPKRFGNEISREEKLDGDLFLRPFLFLGQKVSNLEPSLLDVECHDAQPKCHIPIMHSNYPSLKSHELILLKEMREKRLAGNCTDQFIEQRRGQSKEVELTSGPYMYEAIFPRHKNSDTATFWMAVAKRIRFSDEGSERRNLRKSKLIGIAMCDALLKRFPVKRRIDRGAVEKGIFDFEEKKVSKSLSMIANNSERSDLDWPTNRVFMFIKSQLCTKVAKQYCEAKAGQTLACFQHLILVKFAPICRALESVFRESLPENVYIHSNRNFDDLNDFCVKHFTREGEMSVESDYEAFDSSQDHHILAFEEAFMRAYGVPESYIIDYIDMKTTLGSKLGNFAIMRFTGEFGTFFLNTLANMAFTCMKYNLRGDEPMMFAGDDMCLFKNVNESGKYRSILEKLKLKAVVEKKVTPFFCGWHLTRYGIIKDPELLLNRFMIAIESGKLNECIENYSIELSYAYKLGDKLIGVLNEDLINCHHITIRIVIKNLNLIKGNIKHVFKRSDEVYKDQQPEGCIESWFHSN